MSTLVGYKDLPQEINEQINKVIHVWKEQVSDKLIGVYLHGSISLEAFHPESGDIDILVVVKDSLTVEEKLSIAKDIIEIDGKPRPIEISAIKEEDAKNWKTPGNCVFHYSDFWTEKYQKRFENSDEDFWSAISADIDDYDFSDYNPRYFASNILILGRILSFKVERRILSKYEGGLWMIENVPQHLKHIPQLAMKIWFEGETYTFAQNELEELRDYLIAKIKE